jgi:phosphomethylpyrimidine synthase
MTTLESARAGKITEPMKKAAFAEGVGAGELREKIADGTVVITQNRLRRSIEPLAIGCGLRTKVNANIGTSEDRPDPASELEKLRAAVEAGADAVMDLSTGGDIDAIRKMILDESPLPVGTVPVYQAALDARKKSKSFVELTPDDFFTAVEKHARDGVDFITVHSGVTRESVGKLDKAERIMGIVSRGGALTAEWMKYNQRENPLFEDFDRLIEIAREFDMVLSLGDGLRPGCINDATDSAQIQELMTLGELAKRAFDRGVQVMIEGPGHVPLNEIAANVALEKRLCRGAPFYVLGPLVTDLAPGYDHITSAIGGAVAASCGVDFLCYVTPSEHLRLPTVRDVTEGVVASRIAAHAGDIAKGVARAKEADDNMSRARKALDWDEQIRLSIDPVKARELRASSPPGVEDVCTMCGSLCAIKVTAGGHGG